jgi:hypothetical protein
MCWQQLMRLQLAGTYPSFSCFVQDSVCAHRALHRHLGSKWIEANLELVHTCHAEVAADHRKPAARQQLPLVSSNVLDNDIIAVSDFAIRRRKGHCQLYSTDPFSIIYKRRASTP